MTTRFFRYMMENALQGSTLSLEKKGLCGGDWTPRWEPPASIAPGETAGWQSESGGFMQGTQGWVKYRIRNDSDGMNEGLIYLWWTNPFMGVTEWNQKDSAATSPDDRREKETENIHAQDVKAACDDEGSAGSTFPDPPADVTGLRLQTTSIQLNGNPTWGAPPAEALLVPVPVFIFGTAGIAERAEVGVRIRRVSQEASTPAFGRPPTTTSRSIETDPDAQSFIGTWLAASLTVTIALTGFKRFRVRISDHTQAQPLEIDTTATLGQESAVTSIVKDVDHMLVNAGDKNRKNQLVTTSVAASAMQPIVRHMTGETVVGPPRSELAALDGYVSGNGNGTITKNALRDQAKLNDLTLTDSVSSIIDAIAERASSSDYMIHVGGGIALSLLAIREDGRTVDYQLHYQRVSESGVVLVDQNLVYDLGIR